MRGKCWKLTGLLVLLLVATPSGTSLGSAEETPDHCEQEALRAYWQALKLCQLAENSNPRERCYEAAQAVYFQALENCRQGKGGS